jgi:aminoglycoside phosphotransferase (APT) family kinase protein
MPRRPPEAGPAAQEPPHGLDAPPHGFCDDEETRRLLRSRPPRQALDWVGAALGGTVTTARALRGGTASAVHLLTVTGAAGTRRVVLRRYVRPELNPEEPHIAEHEARALTFSARLGVPTPELLAVDLHGGQAGVPTVLMSRLPGAVRWWPADSGRWLDGLAALLPDIHTAPLPPPGMFPPFTPYRQDSYQIPGWAREPGIWKRAVEIHHQPTPAGGHVFLHRDYHPGNVLWRRGKVSGVVDWAGASIGPPSADVGHCRGNLFPYGLAAVARFTRAWEDLTGATYHPWADIVTTIGFLDGLRDEPPDPAEREVIEEVLARAVSALG